MNKTLKLRKCLFSLVMLIILVLVNRDLLRYEHVSVYRRSFQPGADEKGRYYLTQNALPLKAGLYHLTLTGDFEGRGSGLFVENGDGEIICSADFLPGEVFEIDFTQNQTSSLRLGVSYDPNQSKLRIDRVTVSSDNVLIKDSLLRHAVVSTFVIVIGVLLWLRLYNHYGLRKEDEIDFCLMLLLTLLTVWPLFITKTYIHGDDLYFHLKQLEGMAASLRAGHFPVRIQLAWLENYGFGAGFYYPNLFLNIPALLILLGFSTFASYKIFLVLCTFCALWSCTAAVKAISGSRTASRVSMICYAFVPYRLVDVYYRAALGEVQAFVFLPLVVLGLYEIYHSHTERWWIFALGFYGLFSSHVISLALAGVFTAAFVLIRFRVLLRDKRIFLALLKSFLLVLTLGAWFWLPMLEQMFTTELKINSIVGGTTPSGSYTNWQNLFLFFNNWNYDEPARKVWVGYPLLLLPLLRLLFVRKRSERVCIADHLVLVGFIAVLLCTDLFPWWKFRPLLFRIQYAWRIMLIADVLLCMSSGIYAVEIFSGKWLVPVMFIFSAVCGFPILLECAGPHMREMDYYYYVRNSNTLSGAEYLPVDFRRETAEKNKNSVFVNVSNAEISSIDRRGLSFSFDFRLPVDDAEFTLPLIKYTGYRAEVIEPDGTILTRGIGVGDQGLLTVRSEGVREGTIRVRYARTFAQIAGESISLLTFIAMAVFYLRKKRS